MSLTNKEMDWAVERAEAENAYALQHRADNSYHYVADRYRELYVDWGRPVPIKTGVQLQPAGRLFPASRKSEREGAYDISADLPQRGIVATLREEMSGELGEYRLESDGFNGVVVTGRL